MARTANDTIRISGIDWKVQWCDAGEIPNRHLGLTFPEDAPRGPLVLVGTDCSEASRFSTLCHELIHCGAFELLREDFVLACEDALVSELLDRGARWPKPLIRLRTIGRTNIPSGLVDVVFAHLRRASRRALCEKWCKRTARDVALALLRVGVNYPQG